jgi:hypothetical protein
MKARCQLIEYDREVAKEREERAKENKKPVSAFLRATSRFFAPSRFAFALVPIES